ncbi:MAG: phosphopantothenoylcysteine decarboxylase / phosphopantothenate---cysteine ligase [Actinomycetota bacterium]|jgi:phosphopantothenoylcysteine decarboxylase/phosphopantothenate--cysteine ligase
MSVAGRRIVLGVSGGIAAYKAVEVCRRLMDLGAFVSPILTPNATKFIGAATFSAVASERALTSLYDNVGDPSPHTRLGQAADLIIVAPATARVLAAYATGSSEGLLTATLLATRAPVLVCPAMHTEMWEHPAVQDNLAILRRRGVHVLEPESGHLAGGDIGKGRLPEPSEIVKAAEAVLAPQDLKGVRVLVTAGGTREAIDAVRVITNRSSGKQGHAIAEAAAARGASVTLVTTTDRAVSRGIERVAVNSASDMLEAVTAHRDASDVIVMAAAVADFRPAAPAANKIKKDGGVPEIVLEPTDDILRGLGEVKRPGQILVGFAAETDDVVANATAKLTRKNLDLVVANDVSAPGVGFDHDTNAVTIVSADGPVVEVPLSSKQDVARALLDAVATRLRRSTQ